MALGLQTKLTYKNVFSLFAFKGSLTTDVKVAPNNIFNLEVKGLMFHLHHFKKNILKKYSAGGNRLVPRSGPT